MVAFQAPPGRRSVSTGPGTAYAQRAEASGVAQECEEMTPG